MVLAKLAVLLCNPLVLRDLQKIRSIEIPETAPAAFKAIKDISSLNSQVEIRVAEVNAVLREMDRDFGLTIDNTLNWP